ncbi:hypothetical protein Franean1_4352 [Parafrankia sp. EAN1pec]|nr:hypothetical protein Franean1_4352 [Frankia sp. EAN1pec]
MNCWVCNLPGHAVCRFCGRCVCKDHAKTMPFLLEAFATSRGLEGLAVDEAISCGVCRPAPEPIKLDFLDPGAPAPLSHEPTR